MKQFIFLLITAVLLSSYLSAYSIEQLKYDNKDYFNFNIALDKYVMTMQPGTDNYLKLYVNVDSKENVNFTISVDNHRQMIIDYNPFAKATESFSKPIEIKLLNIEPSSYPINVSVSGELNGKRITKTVSFTINVIDKQPALYLDNVSQQMPFIEVTEFEKRNIIMDINSKEYMTIKLLNSGASSQYRLKYFPKNDDLNIETIGEFIKLETNQEKIVFVTISLGQVDFNYTQLRLYLEDAALSRDIDLGTVNLYVRNSNINLPVKDSNNVDINISKQDTNTNLNVDNLDINSTGLIAGFFALSRENNSIIVLIITIGAIIYLVYRFGLSSKGIFANSVKITPK